MPLGTPKVRKPQGTVQAPEPEFWLLNSASAAHSPWRAGQRAGPSLFSSLCNGDINGTDPHGAAVMV